PKQLGDAGQQFIDRPAEVQPHAGRAVAKPHEMLLGAMDIEMVAVPIGHHAVEHAGAEVKRDAGDRGSPLLALLDLSVAPGICADMRHDCTRWLANRNNTESMRAPSPHPSPLRGVGADRVCRSCWFDLKTVLYPARTLLGQEASVSAFM